MQPHTNTHTHTHTHTDTRFHPVSRAAAVFQIPSDLRTHNQGRITAVPGVVLHQSQVGSRMQSAAEPIQGRERASQSQHEPDPAAVRDRDKPIRILQLNPLMCCFWSSAKNIFFVVKQWTWSTYLVTVTLELLIYRKVQPEHRRQTQSFFIWHWTSEYRGLFHML